MWKKIMLGLAVPALALAGFGFVQSTGKTPEAKVICRGNCQKGDDGLTMCATGKQSCREAK